MYKNTILVCLGTCDVRGTILVQNEIWANDVRAKRIETNDRIVAQELDGEIIIADGNIVVGQVLAVEKLARSGKNILCGETAYGAGKVVANTIITGEPLDLDEGEEAIVSPSAYTPINERSRPATTNLSLTEPVDLIAFGDTEYAPFGNFRDYLNLLISTAHNSESKDKFERWKATLEEAENVCQGDIEGYSNIALVIWLNEIAASPYFRNWNKIVSIYSTFEKHFNILVQDACESIICTINSYGDWIEALSILNRFGALLDQNVYRLAFELVVSNLGLKAKFFSDRLHEKGWQANG